MSNKEAIEVLTEHTPIIGFKKYRQALKVAVQALQVLDVYRQCGICLVSTIGILDDVRKTVET